MRQHAHRLVVGVAMVAAVGLLTGFGGAGEKGKVWKPFLSAEAYKELVKRAAKNAEEALASNPDEAAIKKAQFNALMIAGYTMSTKAAPAGELAGTQAAALASAKLAGEKGKTAQARMYMLALLKGVGKGGGERPNFTDPKPYVGDVAELMEHFRTKKKGGEGIPSALQSNARLKGALNGIEEKLRSLSMKKLSDARVEKEAKELALLGDRAAVVGELTYFYAPKKKAKEWHDISLAMRDAGIALAEAARKKNAEAIERASNSLSSSCNQCHSAFRGK